MAGRHATAVRWLRQALPAFMFAWLALAAMIASGAAPPADALTRALTKAVLDCQSPTQQPDHHHHAPDGMVIGVLTLAPAIFALSAGDQVLPAAPALMAMRLALLPPARAPPIQARSRPPSHAPPVLVLIRSV